MSHQQTQTPQQGSRVRRPEVSLGAGRGPGRPAAARRALAHGARACPPAGPRRLPLLLRPGAAPRPLPAPHQVHHQLWQPAPPGRISRARRLDLLRLRQAPQVRTLVPARGSRSDRAGGDRGDPCVGGRRDPRPAARLATMQLICFNRWAACRCEQASPLQPPRCAQLLTAALAATPQQRRRNGRRRGRRQATHRGIRCACPAAAMSLAALHNWCMLPCACLRHHGRAFGSARDTQLCMPPHWLTPASLALHARAVQTCWQARPSRACPMSST